MYSEGSEQNATNGHQMELSEDGAAVFDRLRIGEQNGLNGQL